MVRAKWVIIRADAPEKHKGQHGPHWDQSPVRWFMTWTMKKTIPSFSPPTQAPWHSLSWGLFLPLVFAGNLVLTTLAWIIVAAMVAR